MGLVSRLALSFAAAAALTGAASADPRQSSNLGGGFIEFLVTGNSGRAAPTYQSPAISPRYATQVAAPLPDEQYQPAVRPVQGGLAPMPQVGGFDGRYERQVVSYPSSHRAGTIIIDTPNRYLYLVQDDGKALRYGIGVGRPGFEWAGVKSVTRKAEWPNWTPPPEMLKRRPDLPRFMAGGPDNPLGARALYLGSSLYRIHGTNEPSTIGQAVSSGCIRLRNEDVSDLYERVRVGAKVVVM
ncbi:MAG: L,D-transpeptidase [Proteobacteria bacterium]|nr:L,D-transpeptidase [Pseudomonadota bacterium]